LIASWPGRIEPGTTSDHISAFYDFLPTVCDLIGAPVPDQTDGISYVPTIFGNRPQPEHDFLYWEFPSRGGQQAVRIGKWKGIRQNIMKEENLEIELYDLEKDPREQTNLAAENQEIISRMKEIFKNEHTVPEITRFRMSALGDPIPDDDGKQ
jgi:arylsulfatase